VEYKPIALSSCILKLLEKFIKARLDRFVELDLLLSFSQFDFRKGKSCDDCFSILMLEVHKDFWILKELTIMLNQEYYLIL